jgi:hypothetical protein
LLRFADGLHDPPAVFLAWGHTPVALERVTMAELKLVLQMTRLKYRVLSVLDANVQPALSAVRLNQFSRI